MWSITGSLFASWNHALVLFDCTIPYCQWLEHENKTNFDLNFFWIEDKHALVVRIILLPTFFFYRYIRFLVIGLYVNIKKAIQPLKNAEPSSNSISNFNLMLDNIETIFDWTSNKSILWVLCNNSKNRRMWCQFHCVRILRTIEYRCHYKRCG